MDKNLNPQSPVQTNPPGTDTTGYNPPQFPQNVQSPFEPSVRPVNQNTAFSQPSQNTQTMTMEEVPPPPQISQQNTSAAPITDQVEVPPPVVGQPQVAIQSKKSRKGLFLLIILVMLVIWGVVGYLAYQNYFVKNKTPEEQNQTQVLTPSPVADPTSNWISFKGTILAFETKLPPNWIMSEDSDPNLGDQKLVTFKSPDLIYSGANIIQGFEFRVGPYSTLSATYESFESFLTAENQDRNAKTETINGIQWLIYDTTAKSLLDSYPLTISIYSSDAQKDTSITYFKSILDNFKLTQQATESGSLNN